MRLPDVSLHACPALESPDVCLRLGCDYHPGFQEIAFANTETGECSERRLTHREEAEQFYGTLKERSVRVGVEASGHAGWFERSYWPSSDLRPNTLILAACSVHRSSRKVRDCWRSNWPACGRKGRTSVLGGSSCARACGAIGVLARRAVRVRCFSIRATAGSGRCRRSGGWSCTFQTRPIGQPLRFLLTVRPPLVFPSAENCPPHSELAAGSEGNRIP